MLVLRGLVCVCCCGLAVLVMVASWCSVCGVYCAVSRFADVCSLLRCCACVFELFRCVGGVWVKEQTYESMLCAVCSPGHTRLPNFALEHEIHFLSEQRFLFHDMNVEICWPEQLRAFHVSASLLLASIHCSMTKTFVPGSRVFRA